MLALTKLEPKYIKKIYIPSQSADPSPPLGTILGNLGVNTVNFCTNFNLFTKLIPIYFLLKVTIFIYDNRSTSFTIDLPSTGYILNLLKFDKIIKVRVFDRIHDKTISCVLLQEVICLAKLKFPYLAIEKSFKILFGSVRSLNIYIVKEKDLISND